MINLDTITLQEAIELDKEEFDKYIISLPIPDNCCGKKSPNRWKCTLEGQHKSFHIATGFHSIFAIWNNEKEYYYNDDIPGIPPYWEQLK